MNRTQPPTTTTDGALRPVPGQKTATGVFDTRSEVNLLETKTFTPELRWGVRYSRSDPIEKGADPNRFLYALGNPLSYSDTLGLTSVWGFDQEETARVMEAVENVKNRLRDTCCAGDRADELLEELDSALILFDPNLEPFKTHGKTPLAGWIDNFFYLGAGSFISLDGCGLEATILHETYHLSQTVPGRWNENGARILEGKCYHDCLLVSYVPPYLQREGEAQDIFIPNWPKE